MAERENVEAAHCKHGVETVPALLEHLEQAKVSLRGQDLDRIDLGFALAKLDEMRASLQKHMLKLKVLVIGGGPFGLSTAVHLASSPNVRVVLCRPSSQAKTSHNDRSRLYRTQGVTGFWSTVSEKAIGSMERFGVELEEVGYVGISNGESPWRLKQGGLITGVPPKYHVSSSSSSAEWMHDPQDDGAGYFDPLKWRQKMEVIFRDKGGIIIDGKVTRIKEEDGVTVEVIKEGAESSMISITGDKVALAPGCYINTIPIILLDGTSWAGADVTLKSQYTVSVVVSSEDVPRLPTCTMVYGGPTKGLGPEEADTDSFYYVPPILEGGVWKAKMGHGKAYEEIIPSREQEEIDRWFREGGKNASIVEAGILKMWRSIFKGVEPIESSLVFNGITTDTPNGEPILSLISLHIGVCTGCNGYGAKAGDEIGRLMANLITKT